MLGSNPKICNLIAYASVTAEKKEYMILPTDTLEFEPEAIITTRANGQRLILAMEHRTSIRITPKTYETAVSTSERTWPH